jgi:hypothetical protein
MRFARIALIPERSINLPTPVHRHREPAMERLRVMAFCAPSVSAEATVAPRPVAAENKRETVIIPNQIQLIIMVHPPHDEEYA